MGTSEIPSFVCSLESESLKNQISIFKNYDNAEKIDFFKIITYGHMVLCICYLDGADVRKTIYNPYKSFLIDLLHHRNG